MELNTVVRLALGMASVTAHLHARGILHGDLYAHNILWNPATAQTLLSDFGAATLLPAAGNPLRSALQALEVRAFGCLLEELLARVAAATAHKAALVDKHRSVLIPRLNVIFNSLRENKTVTNEQLARQIIDVATAFEAFVTGVGIPPPDQETV